MNPWWLRPPGEEGPSKDKKAQKPAKQTQKQRQPEQQEKKTASVQPQSGRGRGTRRRRGATAGKGQRPNGGQRRVAVFYDAESADQGIDLDLILGRLAEKGRLIAKRAYGDWRRHGDLGDSLRDAGLEIVDLPQGPASGQGSAGIKLAVDAIDLCVSKEPCEVFVIVSGNGDFSPLVARLQEAKAEVVGVGMREAASAQLVEICDEYLYCDELTRQAAAPAVVEIVEKEKNPVFGLLVETIENLESQGGGTIWGSALKQEMRRQQPGFDVSELGYATFTDLLEDAERHEVIHLERDDRSGSYYVTGLARQ